MIDNDAHLNTTLRISEIFLSLQGETASVGYPTVFVRLWGCNLRCPGWPCDSLNSVLHDGKMYHYGRSVASFASAGDKSGLSSLDGDSEVLRGYIGQLADDVGELSLSPVMYVLKLREADTPHIVGPAIQRSLEHWGIRHAYVPSDGSFYISKELVQAFLDVYRPTKIPGGFQKTWLDNWTGDAKTIWEVTHLVDAKANGAKYCTITGGEPTIQPGFARLALALSERYNVNVETNGSRPLDLELPVRYTVDMKPPGSGEHYKMLFEQYRRLRSTDEIKLVCGDIEDLLQCREMLRCCGPIQAQVLVSPVFGRNAEAMLAEWIMENEPLWRLQLQVHKILWPTKTWGI